MLTKRQIGAIVVGAVVLVIVFFSVYTVGAFLSMPAQPR